MLSLLQPALLFAVIAPLKIARNSRGSSCYEETSLPRYLMAADDLLSRLLVRPHIPFSYRRDLLPPRGKSAEERLRH